MLVQPPKVDVSYVTRQLGFGSDADCVAFCAEHGIDTFEGQPHMFCMDSRIDRLSQPKSWTAPRTRCDNILMVRVNSAVCNERARYLQNKLRPFERLPNGGVRVSALISGHIITAPSLRPPVGCARRVRTGHVNRFVGDQL